MHRADVLWDARRRIPPRFTTDSECRDMYVDYCPHDGQLDADLAFAQRLQESIDEKDSITYNKRKLQLQRDSEYAQSLATAEAGNIRLTRAKSGQQQMSSINDREHLQTMLDIVAPPSIIEDSEEDEEPIALNQLEELEEIIQGQLYQPEHYSQANVTFHGSAPEGSPDEIPGEDSD